MKAIKQITTLPATRGNPGEPFYRFDQLFALTEGGEVYVMENPSSISKADDWKKLPIIPNEDVIRFHLFKNGKPVHSSLIDSDAMFDQVHEKFTTVEQRWPEDMGTHYIVKFKVNTEIGKKEQNESMSISEFMEKYAP